MRRIFAPVFLLMVLPGCYAATKATVDITSAQQGVGNGAVVGRARAGQCMPGPWPMST